MLAPWPASRSWFSPGSKAGGRHRAVDRWFLAPENSRRRITSGLDWKTQCGHTIDLNMPVAVSQKAEESRYSTGELVRRLLAIAWKFRGDCLLSIVWRIALLLLGLPGLQLLGLAVDV